MAKNLVDGTNIVVEENENDISLNLSDTFNTNLDAKIINKNVYSTEETIVGTYKGSPLYRKIVAENQSVTNNTSISLSDLNIETLVHLYSRAKRNDDNREFEGNLYDNSNRKFEAFAESSNSNIRVWADTTANYTATFTLEYTKTTD